MKNHNCYKIKYDPRDWVLGDGNIKLKASGNPDWTGNYWFKELQLINGFETDDCVIFGFQESYDAQVDRMIQNGELPQSLLDFFTLNGYMDSNSSDGKPHFHTSERFTAYLTGNGFNGNAAQDPCKAAQEYGCIPWTDWPFDQTINPQNYFDKPPQTLLDKGKLFNSLMGGKNCLYHWIHQGTDTARSLLYSAKLTAPVMLAIATTDGWNQELPTSPVRGTVPNHLVDDIGAATQGEHIFDHYIPFDKYLSPSYSIPQAFQMVVQYIPPPPPILPTPTSTVQQNPKGWSVWLSSVSAWLSNILERLSTQGRAKLGGAARSEKWPEFRKEFAKTHLPVCAICGGTKKLNLHHLKPFHVYPQLELDESNVTWLCNEKECHIRVGHLGNFQSINPNGKEDIVIWRDKIRERPMTPDAIQRSFHS